MASGKSTIGKKLARKMNLDFFDLDNLIETKAKQSISEIFSQKGENEFRKIEKTCLLEIIEKTDFVLSTGGGTPCFYKNIEIMNKIGVTIYLQMDAATIANRIENAKTQRPLIKNRTGKKLREFIKENLEQREAFYKQAKHTMPVIHTKLDDIISLCLAEN